MIMRVSVVCLLSYMYLNVFMYVHMFMCVTCPVPVDAPDNDNIWDDDDNKYDDNDTEATIIEKGYGDLEAAFDAAYDIVEMELRTGRHSGVPLECRGGLARINPDSGGLEYYGATKRAHPNRDQIARTLGLDRQAWIFSRAVWVAGSAFAVSYIPRISSFAPLRSGSDARCAGSRIGESIC